MLLAYLLGSVSGSLMLGRLQGIDIREVGSGNAGATNALRARGVPFALGVAIIDVGKGMLAAGWIPQLGWLLQDPLVERIWVITACGMAAVVGHIYPFWHQFRGGKGGATVIGVYAILAPKVLLPAAMVFVISVILTGYVGLSTMLTVISAVIFAVVFYTGNWSIAGFAAAMAMLIVFAHRSNLQRMLGGTENRVERAMIWRK